MRSFNAATGRSRFSEIARRREPLLYILGGEIGPCGDNVITQRSTGDELQDKLDTDPSTTK